MERGWNEITCSVVNIMFARLTLAPCSRVMSSVALAGRSLIGVGETLTMLSRTRSQPPRGSLLLPLLLLPLASVPLIGPSRAADPFVTQGSLTLTRFTEKTISSGVSRPIPSVDLNTLSFQESSAAPNGGDFAGGHVRVDDLINSPGVQLVFSGVSLANNSVAGQAATLHSEGITIATNNAGYPVTSVDYGVWAGIHGYLDAPPIPGQAPAGFVSMTVSSGNDTNFADNDFNPWYEVGPSVEIASNFADGAGSYVHASSYSSFQYLNPEHTEFVAFGLSRFPPMALNGITGIEQHLLVDVTVGPGTHVEAWAPPAGVPLPIFGGGVGSPRNTAAVPEPGSLLLLCTAPIGLWVGRRRRG